tara:strand:- start:150 stop:803 length:654 start_codon:yes stop_codon:yes gene_type:complete
MGRTIAIGDVHGCAREFEKLLKIIKPQSGDRIIQIGDLINKGPDSANCIAIAKANQIETLMGNHEWRLLRAKKEKGLQELNSYNRSTAEELSKSDWKFLKNLPKFIYDHRLNTIFVHGGFIPNIPWHKQCIETVTSVQVITKSGLPEKRSSAPNAKLWSHYWKRKERVIYGHTPRRRVYKRKNTLCLDTGCVYGGQLTAYSIEEKRLISVRAKESYC